MTIVERIMNGEFDNELKDISFWIGQRNKALRLKTTAKAMVEIKVGDIVVLRNLKPQYVNGLTAKVTGKMRTKLTVEIEDGQYTGRFGRKVTVPASCLDKV